jgi:site-specific DNA-methyltransferase (adenine-specific)/modification methylase
MAGIRDEMQGFIRSIFAEAYAKLQGRPVKDAMDVAANLAAATIAFTTAHPERRDAIANELAENVKILIKNRYARGCSSGDYPVMNAETSLNGAKRAEHLAEGVTLYLGDCREILPTLGKVDALVTDPPYGMNLGAISGGVKYRMRHSPSRAADYTIIGDDEPFDPSHLLSFPKLILFGANHYASRLPSARKWIVWDKRAGGTSDNQADCELAWTNLRGPERLYAQLWRGMVRAGEENIACGQERVHPTQKPVALMDFCLRQCALEKQSVVCDPYMGAGATGVAACRLGLQFIGIEIEPKYFDVACRRIADALARPDMFIEPPKPAPKQEAML